MKCIFSLEYVLFLCYLRVQNIKRNFALGYRVLYAPFAFFNIRVYYIDIPTINNNHFDRVVFVKIY